jgi:hypothetical protein
MKTVAFATYHKTPGLTADDAPPMMRWLYRF